MKLSEIGVVALTVSLLTAVSSRSMRASRIGQDLDLDGRRVGVVAHAVLMYLDDHDDRFPLLQRNGTRRAPPPNDDRVWGQLVLPYHGDMVHYRDPADPVTESELLAGMPACDTSPIQCEFNIGYKSHRGLNYQVLSPFGALCGPGSFNQSVSTGLAEIHQPEGTLMLVDSIYDRVNGVPFGGGTHAVDPPARYTTSGQDLLAPSAPCRARMWLGGWNPTQVLAWNQFGAVWGWHKGHAVVAFIDGHTQVMSVGQLTAGATVLDAWRGWVYDRDAYLWDRD